MIKQHFTCFESFVTATHSLPLAWEMGQRPWQRACPKPVPTKLCSGAGCCGASNSLKWSGREKPNPELAAPMGPQAGGLQPKGKDSPLPSAGAFSPGEGNSLLFSNTDPRQQPKNLQFFRHVFCSAFTSSWQVLSLLQTQPPCQARPASRNQVLFCW